MRRLHRILLAVTTLSIGCILLPHTALAQAASQASNPPETTQQAAPKPEAPARLPIPPWAEVSMVNAVDNHPQDKGGRRFAPALGGLPQALKPGFGPSAGIQVNLASGVESYLPAADVIGHNPTGSDAVFQRSFRSDRALKGYGSPGLSPGWVHNYDIIIRPLKSGRGWSELDIIYPSGEKDRVKPTLDESGTPTGTFQVANGAPMTVEGTPAASVNEWQALVVKWRSADWYFSPHSKDTYVLTQIENMRFEWDERRALTAVTDATTGDKLLTLSYDLDGYLAAVVAGTGIMRTYMFGVPQAGDVKLPCLLLVSQIFSKDEAVPPAHWAYGYTTEGGNPLLSSVSVPASGGQGVNTCAILYEKARVVAHVDANGNQRRYTYSPNHTLVQVGDASGNVVLSWTQNYDDLGRNTGTTDAEGHSTGIKYGDGSDR